MRWYAVVVALALAGTACSAPTQAVSSVDTASDGPTPAVSPTPTPTATPVPTVELPTATPEPPATPAPLPTDTPVPTPTLTPTATPRPTPTATPRPLTPTPTPIAPRNADGGGGGFAVMDDPKFVSASQANYLSDNSLVLGYEGNGEARAYPVSMMWFHHIVNDTVGGSPVLITY